MHDNMTPERVHFGRKSFEEYLSYADKAQMNEITRLSAELQDIRVLHINATAYGGGVAEVLSSLLPLFNDLGIETEWRVLSAGKDFFEVTKTVHNALQGKPRDLTEEMKETYLTYNLENARNLARMYDFVVIHDPQPLGMIKHLKERFPATKFIWRCHIDLSNPNKDFLDFLRPFLEKADRIIFSREHYSESLPNAEYVVIHPSIDPLSNKNRPLKPEELEELREKYETDIDWEEPLVTQVSRYDPWKDPVGVTEAFKIAKKQLSHLQLVLIGSMADDDPEAMEVYDEVKQIAKTDEDIHVYKDLTDKEVNAFQQLSDVVIQKSIREGFGLTVSEALWKGTPVIGGNVGGIPLQIREKDLLVESPEECAEKIVHLFKNSKRITNGDERIEYIRENFLVIRHLLDYLRLFKELRD